jgi:hypothetical protein
VDANEPLAGFPPGMHVPPLPPRDYSAAYVEELINQHAWAIQNIEQNLALAQHVLDKLRVQIAPH